MSILKFSSVLVILLVFASQFFVSATRATVSESEAALALTNAEKSVVSAFQVVSEAEQGGANVSGLLAQLNGAEGFFAEAQMAFRLENFAKAVHSANLCYDISESVKNQADELWLKTVGPRIMGIDFTVYGSLIGMVAVGLGSFWCWHFFKRRYYQKVLRMKPEVGSSES
jgi:hypothetical protein